MFKKLFLFLFLITSFIYSDLEDTITYRQKYGAYINSAFLDVQTGALRVITSEHSHIHNYEAYSLNIIDTLLSDEILMLAFLNGDKEIHLKFVAPWSEGSPNLFGIVEDPDTIDLSTDTLTPRNRFRGIGDVLFPSSVIVTDSVDTAEGGIDLSPAFFGGGATVGNTSIAGSVPSDLEWILERNTFWYIFLQNKSGATKVVTLQVFWYETP